MSGQGRWTRLVFPAAALAAFLVLGGAPAGAVGTISQTSATVAVGTAPSLGTLTINPAATGVAPVLPSVGAAPSAPAMTGAMPAFAGGGTGSDGAYSASADTTLAGGTWNFTSFTVTNEATVTVTGAATILVQGDATIFGAVITMGAAESLTLRTGGDFRLLSGSLPPRVAAAGGGADVLIAAGAGLYVGDATAGLNAIVRAMNGNVELRAHGTDAADDDLNVVSGQVLAPNGAVTLLSNASMQIGGSSATAPGEALAGGGAFTARAFGAKLDVALYGEVDAADAAPATIECAVRLDFYGQVFAAGGTALRLAAVQGPLNIGGGIGSGGGSVAILSGGDITMTGDDVEVSTWGGAPLSFSAVGDFELSGTDVRAYSSNGDFTLVAGGSVHVGVEAWIYAYGDVSVRSTGGSVVFEDVTEITAEYAIDVRAFGAVQIGEPTGNANLYGESVYIVAGAGGVTLDAATSFATEGDFTVLSDGPIVVARTVSAKGSVSLASLQDDVDVQQATVRTNNQISTGITLSGSVTIESWSASGTIDADGATVVSGNADGTSGDVSLLVHGTAGGGPPAVISFLLPKKVVAKLDGADSRLTAAGSFDMGPDAVDLTAATTVSVGDLLFSFAGLTSDGKGLKFVHAEDGLSLLVMPNRYGSSNARFRLKATGETLVGAIDPEGTLDLGFDNGQVDGTGTVRLVGGKYVLGRTRGSLVTPNLYLAKGKAVLNGDGLDSLKMVVGLATDGGTPDEAPDLEIGFGDGFTASLPGSAFTRSGEVYRAKADGISAVLDYRRELLKVSVKGATLGAFPVGPQAVSVVVTLGDETREVRVRMVRKDAKLLY